MTSINAYLAFNGNCREAMNFYHQCMGGDLLFETVGQSPIAEKMPPQMKDAILHATLTNGNIVLMASDMVGEKGLTKGNSVSLMINCNSEWEIKMLHDKLSEGGTKNHMLEVSFWGALFGDVTDKYGNHWLLHFPLQNI